MTDQPTLQPVVNPREHCGDLPPSLFGGPRTECVLRPDHSGSHADDRGGRWWIDPTAPQEPASAPVPAQDTPGGPGRQPDAPESPQTAVERRTAQSGVDTPGCDCGHGGMGVGWHGTDCAWRARTTRDNPAASSNAVDNCCVCGGSPVVYRNYREQPFCWPCADCSCNQDVCVRTGINDPAVSGDAALRQQIAAAEHRLRLAHEARRAKEYQLDGIRRALCDVGAMRDDDPYSHADLEDVIRQVFMPPLPVASGEWLRTGTLDLSIPDQPQEPQ